MPKGVDHILGPTHQGRSVFVQKSLMPKGVDHLTSLQYVTPDGESAKIFDAERR